MKKSAKKSPVKNQKLKGREKAIQSHIRSAGKRNQARRDSKNR